MRPGTGSSQRPRGARMPPNVLVLSPHSAWGCLLTLTPPRSFGQQCGWAVGHRHWGQSLQEACPGPRASFSTGGWRREVSGFYDGSLWGYLVNVANTNFPFDAPNVNL